jgi:hypothetical protein
MMTPPMLSLHTHTPRSSLDAIILRGHLDNSMQQLVSEKRANEEKADNAHRCSVEHLVAAFEVPDAWKRSERASSCVADVSAG